MFYNIIVYNVGAGYRLKRTDIRLAKTPFSPDYPNPPPDRTGRYLKSSKDCPDIAGKTDLVSCLTEKKKSLEIKAG